MRLIFGWLVAKHLTMEEWRYAWMGYGAQSVMTDGTTEMLRWCVDNWDMMDVSVALICTVMCYVSTNALSASYPLLSHNKHNPPLYNLDEVQCNGTEQILSNCSHSGIGVHNCGEEKQAGVICTSKFCISG